MPTIMRWLAVLPGATLCFFAALFPLHLILYQSLTRSGFMEPYPVSPERLLGPLFSALAFVWVGARIAPARKIETAVVLGGILLLVIGAVFALAFTGARFGESQLTIQMGGLPPVGAIVGAFVGLYLVRVQNNVHPEKKFPATHAQSRPIRGESRGLDPDAVDLEIGRQISWSSVVLHTFRICHFDRAGTTIAADGQVFPLSESSPYGYLLVESPILERRVRLPIIHRDDFLLAASVFDDPGVDARLSEEELLVTYAPEHVLHDGRTESPHHVLHYVISPRKTLDQYYSVNNDCHKRSPKPEKLSGPFVYSGSISVRVNSEFQERLLQEPSEKLGQIIAQVEKFSAGLESGDDRLKTVSKAIVDSAKQLSWKELTESDVEWIRGLDFHYVGSSATGSDMSRMPSETRTRIVTDWGAHLGSRKSVEGVFNSTELPHPKDMILRAICEQILVEDDEDRLFAGLITGAQRLANYQDNFSEKNSAPKRDPAQSSNEDDRHGDYRTNNKHTRRRDPEIERIVGRDFGRIMSMVHAAKRQRDAGRDN